MPKFKVALTQKVYQHAVVSVEATNEDDARDAAKVWSLRGNRVERAGGE